MNIKKRILAIALISVITIIALFASAWFFVSYQLSRMDTYKESITKAVAEKLNRDVSFETGKAALTFSAGLAFKFTNVVIMEKDRSSNLLNIKTAFFRVDILPLLRNRLVLREVLLDHPHLSLKRDRAGLLNIADLLTKEKKKNTLEFRKLTIEKGLVTFLDQAASEEGLLTSLDNLYCKIDSPIWGDTSRFRITTSVLESENKAELSLEGTFHPSPSEKPVSESTVEASIRLKGTDIKHYRSYLNNHAPIEQLAGRLNAETTFSGTLSNFTSKGTVTVKDALLHYPRVFRSRLEPGMVHVDYTLTRKAGYLNLDIARLAIDRFEAMGHFAIKAMDQVDPWLEATAVTATFPLKEIQSYIPWGIIPRDVGSFIEAHVKDGNFRLVEGKLNGRLSQIENINKKENAGVIFIRAEVNKGIFVTGKAAPDFHDISGTLELKDRQFFLKKMKGMFGASPCALEGNISDFALPQLVVYTADMNIQPARDEVLWLLGKEKFREISFDGPSTLLLSGKGPAENYHITARWDMTEAAYAYPKVMEKPKARKNRLTAEINLKKDVAAIPSFNYDLPPVNVSGSAMYRFSGKKPLSLSIQSKAFDLREAIPILPVLRTFDPAGTCLLAITGRGDLSNPGSMQWKGNVSLTNVSLKPSASVKFVKGLTGKVVFKGNTVETSLFKARIGESDIQGKCRIDNFRKPKAACQFNADLLRAVDVGLQSSEGEVTFHDTKGLFTIEDKLIRVDKLSLRLGKSSCSLSGDVRNFANPKIKVSLIFPYLNSDDAARLMTLQYQRADGASPKIELDATLRVDAGTVNGADFRKLNAGLKFSRGILNIETLEAGFFEGNLKGKGKVSIHPDGQNHYEAIFSIERMSLEKLQSFLGIRDSMVTGNLWLAGDVSATGRNADDLKKTAAGIFQVRAERGVLKKFSVLSKIFSMLNVLQLAKFQLPDMAKDGMPYDTITAHLSLHDGVFFSEDFFIGSDAMQISGVGKVDFLKKELDNTVGVHPLQTMDRIAAKIPVAGWLLTDEKGNLITVHFKVDGAWDDPKVNPVPARSIAKGTLDIFRRFFQLPEKLITDTGEVILGH